MINRGVGLGLSKTSHMSLRGVVVFSGPFLRGSVLVWASFKTGLITTAGRVQEVKQVWRHMGRGAQRR